MEAKKNIPLIAICAFALITVAMIILGIKVCNMPVVVVCLVVIIEAALAMCLQNIPIWVHGLVLIAELIVGILCELTAFVIFAAIVYVAAIVALHFIEMEKA